MPYPNSPCCPDEEHTLPVPDPCGDECEETISADCVIVPASSVCGEEIVIPANSTVSEALSLLLAYVCGEVVGVAGTITINSVVTTTLAAGVDATVAITETDASTPQNRVINFLFGIPAGIAGDDGIDSDLFVSSTTSIAIGNTGTKSFTFVSDPGLGWVVGTRVRAVYNGSNFMEGLITAVNAVAGTVSFTADYAVGSGTYAVWNIVTSGEVGTAASCTGAGGDTVSIISYSGSPAVAVTNTGSTEAATFKFDFDIPAPVQIASAAVAAGILTLTMQDGTTVVVGGSVAGVGVPAGGTANQILSKIDSTNYNTQWVNDPSNAHIPTGGTADQILRKQSSTNYDVAWEAELLGVVPPALAIGNPVPIVFASTETELKNAIDQFNGSISGYSGAIIKLTAHIVLTTSHTFNMTGIEIHGNGIHRIDFNNAGTVRTITISNGSPLFKDVVLADTTKTATATGGSHTRIFNILSGSGVRSVVKFEECIFDNIAQGDGATGSSIYLQNFDTDSRLIFERCSILTTIAADAGTPTVSPKLCLENLSSQQCSVHISNMTWLNSNAPQGSIVAHATLLGYASVIYFQFAGTWVNSILDIDMESYAFSTLNSKFGVNDATSVYIKNSVFMYGDNNSSKDTLKPNEFGIFGWNNTTGTYPLNHTSPYSVFDDMQFKDYYWCDDFDYAEDGAQLDVHQTDLSVLWTPGGTAHAAANQLLQVEDHGGIELTTNGAATNSEVITNINPIEVDKNPVFEIRFKVGSITTTTAIAYIGLTETANPVDNADFQSITDDYIFVGIDSSESNPGNIRLVTDNNGTQAITGDITDLGSGISAGTYCTIRVECSDTGQPRIWINTSGGTVTPDDEIDASLITNIIAAGKTLYPMIFIQSDAGSAQVLTVDYFKVWSDR